MCAVEGKGVGVATATPSVLRTAAVIESASANAFPVDGCTTISGQSVSSFSVSTLRKPLKTERTHTMAAVATATPIIETAAMALTALCDFFDHR